MTPKDVKMLAYELMGVIVDVEEGHGFDQVCLDTIKRVQNQLFELAKQLADE
jgi:hypothetical protein